MKIKKILVVCLSLLFLAAAGCDISNGGKTRSSVGSSFPQTSAVTVAPSSSATADVSTEPVSSDGVTNSKKSVGESTASVTQSSSKISQNNSDWIAYDTNKDDYKLHIKKADGTEDKVIVNDVVLAPCVVGEWVYYIYPLQEFDKVKLDGSQKTKVCDIPEIVEINGSTSVTAEYKDGYILYTTVQMHEVGDKPNPPYYYKLDPDTDKITEVKG